MSPDKVQARKMVLVSAFMLAAIAVYRERRSGARGDFRALWGVGVVSLLLSILADFAPTIAGPFALLTVLGSLASGDVSILDRVLGTGSTAKGANTGTGKTNTPTGPANLHGVTSVIPRQTTAGGTQ